MSKNNNQLTDFLKSQEPIFLSKAKKGYVCPECGNGTGKDGTGITLDRTSDRWHCFRCGLHEDTYGLLAKHLGTGSYADISKEAERIYGSISSSKAERTEPRTAEPTEKDFTAYFESHKGDIHSSNYLQNRGISEATMKRFNIFYDGDRVIIPTSKGSYVSRATDNNSPMRYTKQGKARLFNIKALEEGKPVFIVEGEIDCLSCLECGFNAIGLGSTANKELFKRAIDELDGMELKAQIILALDDDESGATAQADIQNYLENKMIWSISADKSKWKGKDYNEFLTADREGFISYLKAEEVRYKNELTALEEEEKQEYNSKLSASSMLIDFFSKIQTDFNTSAIPTGFTDLDEELDGGLYEGLYVIGGMSSVGKTTSILQIADNIAEHGHDVLFISLEMARYEIIAKSLSRISYMEQEKRTNPLWEQDFDEETAQLYSPRTVRGITNYSFWRDDRKAYKSIEEATNIYGRIAEHIYLYEGVGNTTVEDIKFLVERHMRITGNSPVVFVDYLQILATPRDMERATDKQITDKNVLELKRLSRDYKIPVVAVSSFNRASYSQEVSMASFKESGAVEYSSDVLIGLQYLGQGENSFKIQEARKKTPREVQMVILKNRNGRAGGHINLYYMPQYNALMEVYENEILGDDLEEEKTLHF